MGIHFVFVTFLTLKVTVAIDLHFTKHHKDIQKDIYILDGLRVSK